VVENQSLKRNLFPCPSFKLQVGDLKLNLLGFLLQASDWVKNQNQDLSFNWWSFPF
jgi:hypothetical protein